MRKKYITLANTDRQGKPAEKKVKVGYSYSVALFGWMAEFCRGNFVAAAMLLCGAMLTVIIGDSVGVDLSKSYPLVNIVWAYFANQELVVKLKSRGWIVTWVVIRP